MRSKHSTGDRFPLVGSVDGTPITRARIWAIVKRFFAHASSQIESDAPSWPTS
jgi:hypothetical protein